jgi:hypothetical protein
MELCETCRFWKRWRKHPQIEAQHHWGDCNRLLSAEDHITLGANNRDGEWVEIATPETNERFGCILHEQVF